MKIPAILLSFLISTFISCAAPAGFMNRSIVVNDSSLIGYWSLDACELVNNTNLNRVGSAVAGGTKHGVMIGTPLPLTNGAVREALKFGAVTANYVDTFYYSSNSPTRITNFTIALWIKAPGGAVGTPQPRFFSDGGYGNTSGSLELVMGNAALSAELKPYVLTQGTNSAGTATQGYRFTSVAVPTNQWVHVAATFAATNSWAGEYVLYTNGTNNSGSYGAQGIVPRNNSLYSFRIGRNGGGTIAYAINYFIDDVRFYSRALTAAEITQIYNAGR